MAISIRQKEGRQFVWQEAFFYLSALFLIGVVVVLILLFSFEKRSRQSIESLNDEITKTKTPELTALEKEMLNDQRKVRDFSLLFQEHNFPSKFFRFLEENSHSQVFFLNGTMNFQESKFVFSGQTENFLTLGQQFLILEQEPSVKNLFLTEVSINKEGKVGFTINLSLDPKVFKY